MRTIMYGIIWGIMNFRLPCYFVGLLRGRQKGEQRRRKINATPVRGRDLTPGDLFSTAGQDYWDRQHFSLGERVYVRTERPCPPEQEEVIVYRIEITH